MNTHKPLTKLSYIKDVNDLYKYTAWHPNPCHDWTPPSTVYTEGGFGTFVPTKKKKKSRFTSLLNTPF